MIKYYCDRCGRYIVAGHVNASVCVARTFRADFCENCAEVFDKVVMRFVKGESKVNCEKCKHRDKDLSEEPCKSCCEFGSYINFEKRDEEVEADEQVD